MARWGLWTASAIGAAGAGAALAYSWPLLLVSARDEGSWLILPNGQEASARAEANVDAIVPIETLDSFAPTDPAGATIRALEDVLREAGLTGGKGTLAVEARTLPMFALRLFA